jgi:hypothetical protein
MEKEMRKKIFIIGVLMVLSVFSITAEERIKLLIAVDSSNFKDNLAAEITELVEAELFEVTIKESVKKIKEWPLNEYGAVIVINRGTAGHMNRTLIKVLEEGNYPPMVIVTSYGNAKKSKDNYGEYSNVDGISTASLKNTSEISEMAREVVVLLKEVLQ